MKKLLLSFALIACFSLFNVNSLTAKVGCPTGVTTVQSSWWGPSNTTYYTMCSCATIKGYDSSGSCI